jgi:immunity protein, SdpI family
MIAKIPARHLAVAAVGYSAGASLYPHLPEGAPYMQLFGTLQFGPAMIAFLLPTAALLTSGLLGSLWNRDPIRGHEPRLEATYEAIVFRIALFVTAVQLVMVIGMLERAGAVPHELRPVVSRIVPILLGLALVAIGNLLPRMKPNVVIGIRTARTLADQAAWSRTNRMAGNVAVGFGISLVLAAALISPGMARGQVMSAAALGALIVLITQLRKHAHARKQAHI